MSTVSPLVDWRHLKARLGEHEVEDLTLQLAVEDVSAFARGEAGVTGAAWDLEVTSGAGFVDPRVRVVVLDAARRRVLNPDAYVSEQTGDYSYRRAEGTEGTAYFTPAELGLLRGMRPSSTGGLGSLRIVRPGLLGDEHPYVDTTIDGYPSTHLPWSYE